MEKDTKELLLAVNGAAEGDQNRETIIPQADYEEQTKVKSPKTPGNNASDFDQALCSRLTISIIVVTVLANAAYSIVAPFLPVEFARRGVSASVTGYIFSIYSVAVVVASPFIGHIMQKTGRRVLISGGLLLMGLSFICFGCINYIENDNLFIFGGLMSRFLQGLASVSIQVTCYSIATNFYPDRKGMMIGISEASQGLGLMFGPLIGTLLYAVAGYNFMLYSFGASFIPLSILVFWVFPSFVDVVPEEQLHVEDAVDMNLSGQFSYTRRLDKLEPASPAMKSRRGQIKYSQSFLGAGSQRDLVSPLFINSDSRGPQSPMVNPTSTSMISPYNLPQTKDNSALVANAHLTPKSNQGESVDLVLTPLHGEQSPTAKNQNIGLCMLMKDMNYLFAAITGGWAYFLYDYLGPIFSVRLMEMGCDQREAAMFFQIGAFSNLIFSLVLSFAKVPFRKRTLMIVGLIMSCVTNLFMGPSQILGLPQTLAYVAIGQVMLGTFNPVLLIFSLPEMVDVVDRKYANELDYATRMRLYDLSSGFFNAVLGIGQVVGPLYATFATDRWGFSLCCDYIALTSLAIGICYLIFTRSYPEPTANKEDLVTVELSDAELEMLQETNSQKPGDINLQLQTNPKVTWIDPSDDIQLKGQTPS